MEKPQLDVMSSVINSTVLTFADDLKMFRVIHRGRGQLLNDIRKYGEDNIQCTIISSNDTIKDLGVLIDNNLKFHAHTASVISKANRSLAIKELHTTTSITRHYFQTDPNEIEAFLLFVSTYDIHRVNFDGTGHQTIVSGLSNGVAIDFDYFNGRIYWSDVNHGHIRSAPLSTGSPIITLASGLSVPDGLAIDWINNKVYSGRNKLEQSDLNGNYRRTLISRSLDEPRGIALDPLNNALYMTEWGCSPRIEKMHLDGSNRRYIVTQNLVWPNAVTVDYFEPALFWADAWTDIVRRGDLNGNNVVTLLSGSSVYHPFALTQFGERIYWSDWLQHSIEGVSKCTAGLDHVRITGGFVRPTGVHTVHPHRQGGESLCLLNNGGCQHRCVESFYSHYCACNTGYMLNSDQETCSYINECSSSNGGCSQICTNTVGSYQCWCITGFTLSSRTCIDQNECSNNNGGCAQTCQNTVGLYYCTCQVGYNLNSNLRTCDDINECVMGHPCPGECVNTIGSYHCRCSEGQTYDPITNRCIAPDYCASNPCQYQCVSDSSTYQCYCMSGYVLAPDGHSCNDINECQSSNGGCTQVCVNQPGSYQCSCNTGYMFDGNSHTCSRIQCPSPPSISGFTFTCSVPHYVGDTCHVTCTEGNADLAGNDTISCLSTGYWEAASAACTIPIPNEAPTSVVLSTSSVLENVPVDTAIGTFIVTAHNLDQTHTIALVDSPGGKFRIENRNIYSHIKLYIMKINVFTHK
ncbi:pro-epidermal growth factor-like [Dysidea avara]|uniref:pro-epidermal growth factor-like n=1 Tax=Dysidea avara TaxID=196820 RepID=UPI00331AD4A9